MSSQTGYCYTAVKVSRASTTIQEGYVLNLVVQGIAKGSQWCEAFEMSVNDQFSLSSGSVFFLVLIRDLMIIESVGNTGISSYQWALWAPPRILV
jgi:hypothetical protein